MAIHGIIVSPRQRRVRRQSFVLALALAAIFTQNTRSARAQQCVSEPVKQSLGNCSGIKMRAGISKPSLRLSATLPAAKEKSQSRIKPARPANLGGAALRDQRRERLQPKLIKLLLTEISNIERLYKSTPAGNPERPRLLRRLADSYVELESSAFRDKINAETKAQQFRKKQPKIAAKHKKDARRAQRILDTARKSAIRYYRRLNSRHSSWCQFPKKAKGQRGCADEVLYYLAYEHEQAGDLKAARAAYVELTERWKDSRFVPSAYLAFGELFFQEAQGDASKWPFAANFYKEVLKYPPPDNKIYGYAAYKLAYVQWNRGDTKKALEQFKAVIEFAQKYSRLPNATGLMESARRDIISVYALAGDANRAYAYFRPLSGDSGVNSQRTFEMMARLGQSLIDTGHYANAIAVYKDLSKRDRGSKQCHYQGRISQAVMARNGGNKPPIMATLRNQLKAYQQFRRSRHGAKDKLACANHSAELLTETAMAWHLEAVGSGDIRGTDDPATLRFSAELYEMVEASFSAEQFRQFKFPRIVKEDWPTLAKVRFARANLAYSRADWAACAAAFDKVVADDPKGSLAAEAAFAAVICYKKIYLARHNKASQRQSRSDLAITSAAVAGTPATAANYEPKTMSAEQRSMLGAFDRYLCYIDPSKGDDATLADYIDVKFARARSFYEQQHWEQAAWAFRDIALNHSTSEAAIYAAQLSLDSLEALAHHVRPQRSSCNGMMRKDVSRFMKLFCSAGNSETSTQCSKLSTIERNLKRREVETMVKACDEGKAANCTQTYRKAGELYYGIWNDYGKDACQRQAKAGSNKAADGSLSDDAARCARSDEVLYNAARAFQAARLIAKAIDVRRVLLNEKYGLHRTALAKKVVYEIGGSYQAIAVYDLAADWYERFARDFPDMEQAPAALSDAVLLRLGLGEGAKAIADAKLFQRKYGRRRPEQSAQISFAIGDHYASHNNWAAAQRALSRAMAQIDARATVDIRIQAHTLLGRAYAQLGRVTPADREYDKARKQWREPAAMLAKLNAVGGDANAASRRRRKTLIAIGEAHYHFADKKRRKAAAVSMPKYSGAGDRASVEQFIKTKIKQWMADKRAAIQTADDAYQKILSMKPEPPPKWVIKAGAAVGAMRKSFVEDFYRAPYPAIWDSPGFVPGSQPPLLWADVKAAFFGSMTVASNPEKTRAKAAYETCLKYSLKFQYFDEDSRACEEWLSKSYPNDYHLIDEFRGAPTRVNSGLAERSAALQIGGAVSQLPGKRDAAR